MEEGRKGSERTGHPSSVKQNEDFSLAGGCGGEILDRRPLAHRVNRDMLRCAAPASSIQVIAGGAYPAHLHEVGDHDDAGRVLLPDHPPKVLHGLLHWTCQEGRR